VEGKVVVLHELAGGGEWSGEDFERLVLGEAPLSLLQFRAVEGRGNS
jgi:hypothetical protein